MTKRALAVEIAMAMTDTNIPYLHGGNDPAEGGLDCSGFIRFIFRIVGLMPWETDLSAQGLFDRFGPATVHPRAGCLLFYGNDLQHISHVMLAIGASTCVGAAGSQLPRSGVQYALCNYRADLVAIVDPFA